jgi:hypothetical protein
VRFEVASEKVERVQFSLQGQSLTYDVIFGETPKGILDRYTALTGRPALPPAWSFGLWLSTSPKDLLIPLDVHVHDVATALGLTSRKQKDITTVREITDAFLEIFPSDPCKGDFSLFGYGVTHA